MIRPSSLRGSDSVSAFVSLQRDGDRLETWKEIASFFKREVRTVQLWEKHEGLPVRRQQHRKLGSIYAYQSELQDWWVRRSTQPGTAPEPVPEPAALLDTPLDGTAWKKTGPPESASANTAISHSYRKVEPGVPADADPEMLAQYACILGMQFWKSRSSRAIRRALCYFQDAVRLNSRSAEAHAGLANVYVSLSYNHMLCPRQAATKAHRAVARALQLNPGSTDVRNAVVNVLTNCVWDWSSAERECRRMLDAGQMNARTLQLYAGLLNSQGRHQEAVQFAQASLEIEPHSAVANNQLSMAYFYAGDYSGALSRSRVALKLTPQYTMGQALLGRIHAQRNEWDRTLAAFEEVSRLSDGAPFARALVAYAHAGLGSKAKAMTIVEELARMQHSSSYPAYDMSGVYLMLRMKENALSHVAQACAARDMKAIYMEQDPRFAGLRFSPEFQQIATSQLRLAG